VTERPLQYRYHELLHALGRDRQPDVTWVPDALMLDDRLHPAAKLCAVALCSALQCPTAGRPEPTREELQATTGLPDRVLDWALALLQAAGWIETL
jgi:hypothetical protein